MKKPLVIGILIDNPSWEIVSLTSDKDTFTNSHSTLTLIHIRFYTTSNN